MQKTNKPVRMTLAHINDTHSYFEPQSLQLKLNINGQLISPYVSNGGFARIATRAKQLRQQAEQQGREFMFFHAGDCFQGTLYFSLFKGKANADMLNALGIDAMALGNHELDMGNEPVAQFLSRVNFPLLAGNWNVSQENQAKRYCLKDKINLYPYQPESQTARYIVRVIDGEPVAIFGLCIEKMADIANVDSDTPFVNSFATAARTVTAINARGINKIIVISHMGFDIDKQLAQQVAGISLIVGGHTHTLQGDFSDLGLKQDVVYGVRINGTHIVQSGLHAQAIGHCEIDFAADGSVENFTGRNELLFGRRLCIDATLQSTHQDDIHACAAQYLRQHPGVVICKKDPEVQGLLLDKYIPQVRALQQEVVGEVGQKLRHIRIPDQAGGSEIAPLVAESFAHMVAKLGYQVDFSIHNAGGVRTSLEPGVLTVADVAGNLLPFAVPVGVYQLKGKDIALALEGAINNALSHGVIGTGSGSYPYCFNLDYRYHAERPVGERIQSLKLFSTKSGWQPVEQEKLYNGSSSAYTMKGKEGYDALTHMKGEGVVTSLSMAECFIDFVKHYPERFQAAEYLDGKLG